MISLTTHSSAEEEDVNKLLNCPKIELQNSTTTAAESAQTTATTTMQHPAIGFGTYKVGFIPASASSAVTGTTTTTTNTKERTAQECVADALACGYRFLECAEFYGNEAEVGRAIAQSGVARSDLFLCSKVWTTTIEQGPQAIVAQFEQTLADLGTDYLDLYLIHWPVPNGRHVRAWRTLEDLCLAGRVRGIGFSNYAVEDYLELKQQQPDGLRVKPVVNQIEINPFLYRRRTIEFFRNEGVVLQSYRSLRDGKAFNDPTVLKIARAHRKTPAQILGRWCVQHGFVYIPKSVKKERMEENARVFDFSLTEDEMEELNSLTTADAFDNFQALYRKCVNRDTSKDGSLEGVNMNITVD